MPANISPWTARRENLTFFQSTTKSADLSSPGAGASKDTAHALVLAPLVDSAVSPLNMMDATRPSEGVTKGLVTVRACVDIVHTIVKLGVQPAPSAPGASAGQEAVTPPDEKMLTSGASNSWS